jgi:hypothetical protein
MHKTKQFQPEELEQVNASILKLDVFLDYIPEDSHLHLAAVRT